MGKYFNFNNITNTHEEAIVVFITKKDLKKKNICLKDDDDENFIESSYVEKHI